LAYAPEALTVPSLEGASKTAVSENNAAAVASASQIEARAEEPIETEAFAKAVLEEAPNEKTNEAVKAAEPVPAAPIGATPAEETASLEASATSPEAPLSATPSPEEAKAEAIAPAEINAPSPKEPEAIFNAARPEKKKILILGKAGERIAVKKIIVPISVRPEAGKQPSANLSKATLLRLRKTEPPKNDVSSANGNERKGGQKP
jgi:hypothetical protein